MAAKGRQEETRDLSHRARRWRGGRRGGRRGGVPIGDRCSPLFSAPSVSTPRPLRSIVPSPGVLGDSLASWRFSPSWLAGGLGGGVEVDERLREGLGDGGEVGLAA